MSVLPSGADMCMTGRFVPGAAVAGKDVHASNSLISRNSRPARSASASGKGEAPAIVATAVKARLAELVPVAIVPVITWDWIGIPRARRAMRETEAFWA